MDEDWFWNTVMKSDSPVRSRFPAPTSLSMKSPRACEPSPKIVVISIPSSRHIMAPASATTASPGSSSISTNWRSSPNTLYSTSCILGIVGSLRIAHPAAGNPPRESLFSILLPGTEPSFNIWTPRVESSARVRRISSEVRRNLETPSALLLRSLSGVPPPRGRAAVRRRRSEGVRPGRTGPRHGPRDPRTHPEERHEDPGLAGPRHTERSPLRLVPRRKQERAPREHGTIAFLRAHDVQRLRALSAGRVRPGHGTERRLEQRVHVGGRDLLSGLVPEEHPGPDLPARGGPDLLPLLRSQESGERAPGRVLGAQDLGGQRQRESPRRAGAGDRIRGAHVPQSG